MLRPFRNDFAKQACQGNTTPARLGTECIEVILFGGESGPFGHASDACITFALGQSTPSGKRAIVKPAAVEES